MGQLREMRHIQGIRNLDHVRGKDFQVGEIRKVEIYLAN